MSTTAQCVANKLNSERSTGPRTELGKQRSARNASVVHGLTSEKLLALPNEDPAELRAFAEELRNDLAPHGALEWVLADRVISSAWRLRRAGVYEAGIIKGEGGDDDLGLAFFRDSRKGDSMAKLGRYVRECETSLRMNLNLLTLQQARRRGQAVPLPIALDINVTASSDISTSTSEA